MFPWIICRMPLLKSSRYLHKFPIFSHISLVSFSTSTPKISIFDYLVNQHDFSPECASKVSSLSSTEYLNKPQNAGSVLNFLNEIGFSKNHTEALLQKSPRVLSANLESSVKPKIKVFQDLGFQSTDLADIISNSPWLLTISADRLRVSISTLKNVLGPNADICRLFKTSGCRWFLGRDLDRTLIPNVEYLKSCGICSLRIASYVSHSPLVFLANPEKLKGFVQRVHEMGIERESGMFIKAVVVIGSMSREKWELKLKFFRDLGFSKQDILRNLRVAPEAFALSERKIKEVIQLLLSVEDISYIVTCPRLLLCSVEKKLKPRLQVLKALESKNLLKKRPALVGFFVLTDAKFMNKYVIPYSDELGECILLQNLMKNS